MHGQRVRLIGCHGMGPFLCGHSSSPSAHTAAAVGAGVVPLEAAALPKRAPLQVQPNEQSDDDQPDIAEDECQSAPRRQVVLALQNRQAHDARRREKQQRNE